MCAPSMSASVIIITFSYRISCSTNLSPGKVPIAVIKSEHYRQENSWWMRKLLKSRFKHTARMLLNLNSFARLKYLSKNKNPTEKTKKRQYYSAGKSVESVHSIESATAVMLRLGQSLFTLPRFKEIT